MKRPPKSKVLEQALLGAQSLTPPAVSAPDIARDPEAPTPPADWGHGALLNVRSMGGEYVVTLYPEEFDAAHPERALRFANAVLCQDFVSKWYARQHHDPRAMR